MRSGPSGAGGSWLTGPPSCPVESDIAHAAWNASLFQRAHDIPFARRGQTSLPQRIELKSLRVFLSGPTGCEKHIRPVSSSGEAYG